MTRVKFATAIVLMATGLSAATDPFVGKWKWNAEKSPQPKLTYSVKDLGENRYTVTFMGYPVTLTADGVLVALPDKDGGKMSLKKIDEHHWEGMRIQGGTYVTADTISPDEKTLTVNMVSHLLNGETAKSTTTYTRIGTGKGLVGDWESMSRKTDAGGWDVIIEPFEKDGLTFSTPYDKWQVSLHFDGKRYYDQGPDLPKGLSSSAKRIDPHTIQFVGEINGVIDNAGDYKLSEDEKTMTLTVKSAKAANPITWVYDRQ